MDCVFSRYLRRFPQRVQVVFDRFVEPFAVEGNCRLPRFYGPNPGTLDAGVVQCGEGIVDGALGDRRDDGAGAEDP